MRSVWVGNFETQEGLSGCWGAEMNGPVIWTSWRHVSACGQFEVSEAGRYNSPCSAPNTSVAAAGKRSRTVRSRGTAMTVNSLIQI